MFKIHNILKSIAFSRNEMLYEYDICWSLSIIKACQAILPLFEMDVMLLIAQVYVMF
jgi:hypothetical protein